MSYFTTDTIEQLSTESVLKEAMSFAHILEFAMLGLQHYDFELQDEQKQALTGHCIEMKMLLEEVSGRMKSIKSTVISMAA
jgi:hypothetical protein